MRWRVVQASKRWSEERGKNRQREAGERVVQTGKGRGRRRVVQVDKWWREEESGANRQREGRVGEWYK